MTTTHRFRNLIAALALGIATPVAAATPDTTTLHIDLTHYFASDAAEQSSRKQLFGEIDNFAQTHPAHHDPAALDAYLRRAETLFVQLSLHENYFDLKTSLDITDRAASDARDAVSTEGDRANSALIATILHLAPGEFEADMKARPALADFAFEVSQARRNADHTLPADQQLVLDTITGPSLSALWDLYRQTVRTTSFAKIMTAAGARSVVNDRKALLADPDPGIRTRADKEWFAGYGSREPIYAGILLDIVDTRNRIAKLDGFDSAPAEKYFSSYMTVTDVKATFAEIRAHAEVNRRYQNVLVSHIAAATGLTVVHSWDQAAPLGGYTPPHFTIDEMRFIARQSLAPLGRDYVAQFDALLDPKNGRADIGTGGGNRDGGGFSLGYGGTPAVLFVGKYDGTLGGANTVIHEGGHAVHRALMNARQVSPFYENGPHWMFEAFAILNELLLDDHLYRASHDPRAKAYYLNALVNEMTFQVFTSAEEGAIEQAIYDGAAANTIKDGADLDAATASILKDYDIWTTDEPERDHLWMTKTLMYEDPLYLVNYLYAGLLATKLYQMAQDDPADFQRRYTSLLENGFNAPPDELLAKFFGHKMTTSALIPGAMDVITRKTADLESLFRVLDAEKASARK